MLEVAKQYSVNYFNINHLSHGFCTFIVVAEKMSDFGLSFQDLLFYDWIFYRFGVPADIHPCLKVVCENINT
jgi:hypothetical protein